ncbi:hypothetical protein [Flavobacterium yafengii]|uniref:hypothetical protein n=1 Tax=Flavobacterium yafengii TaxID=3041253 RepID=UPI0024A8D77E|nr:hypothetical protein [Flavobacterium yafengii]MDI6046659.1 hypothetical protein [Flavobacterium yafengii]
MTKINKKIVIAALARDCDRSLPKIIKLINELRSNFVWSEVVVIENDSKDDTKCILLDWEKRNDGIKIISQDYGVLTIPKQSNDGIKPLVSFYRIDKMTMYRNMYIKYIKGIEHEIDNVIVIDVDIESFSVEGVLKSITKCEGKVGAIFANGISVRKAFDIVYSKIFYDVFAVYEYPMKENFSFTQLSLMETFESIMNKLKRSKNIRVISAFGGLSVYNYKAIANLEYKVVLNHKNEKEAICEHIPFNTEIIKSGYENFISKEMEVIYGDGHSFGSVVKEYFPKKIFLFIHKTVVILRGLGNKK